MRPKRKKGSKAVAQPLPLEVDQKEIVEIVKATQKMHHKIAFILGWESGLRISEVVNLKPEDFNFNDRTLAPKERLEKYQNQFGGLAQ